MEANSISQRQPLIISEKQQGYAILFFILLIGAVGLSVYSLYDSGWVAAERIRLQNTADNTTYSLANTLARDMNMIAITNRGQIANQVMIGQLVGLASWTDMVHKTAENIDNVATFVQAVPVIGGIVKTIASVIETASSILSDFIDTTAKIVIRAQNTTNSAISFLQQSYHRATYAQAAAVYNQVLEGNDPDVGTKGVAGVYNVTQFVGLMQGEFQQFDAEANTGAAYGLGHAGQELNRQRVSQFAQLINDSRDGFTGKRGYQTGATIFPVRAGLQSRGSTDLVPDESNRTTTWSWTSLDTFSAGAGVWHCRWSGCGWSDTELPVGWGAAHALHDSVGTTSNYYNYRGNGQNSWSWSTGWNAAPRLDLHERNNFRRVDYTHHQTRRYWNEAFTGGRHSTRQAARLAHNVGSSNNLAGNIAVRPFYDFISNDPRHATRTLTLVFHKSGDAMRMQQNLADDFNQGYVSEHFDIAETGGLPANSLYAVASARVEFARPMEQVQGSTPWAIQWGRADGLHEYGNLYNPFWEARLAATDEALLQLVIQATAQ